MKKLLLVVVTIVLAFASNTASAANPLIARFAGVGSSGQYNILALAASNGTNLCGTNYWNLSGGANVVDPRNNSILPEPGNIWIVWNNDAADGGANPIVCFYASLDSIVGMREFFANATISLPASDLTATGTAIPYMSPTLVTTLPSAVYNYVNGSTINFAATDIRPEDAKFASNRVLTALGTFMTGRGFTGLGYQGGVSTPWLGTSIYSSVSTSTSSQANPVDWAFVPSDVDPITGNHPRTYLELPVGADPIMIFVNASNTASGHMGDPNLAISNINSQTLANAFTGKILHVRDLSSASGAATAADAGLHVWMREPLSGTYNTFEFCIPDNNEIAGDYAQGTGRVTGQESGVNPAAGNTCGTVSTAGCSANSGNPFFQITTDSNSITSTRGRVIGSGQMISTANVNPDSIGYSFWSFSSFATSKAANLKYLTVNGVDPLYSQANPNPSGTGVFPQCASTPCVLPMDNIKNGSYPIWSKLRSVYDPTDPIQIATNIVTNAQNQASSTYSDLVAAGSLQVFRSHFAQVVTTSGGGYGPNNGFKTGVPETGGDMGGMVLTVQSELDFLADTGGNQQVNIKQ